VISEAGEDATGEAHPDHRTGGRDVDELLKLVIPAVFLIVWALGQLLNREQPQPRPRPVPRGEGGLPPRPDLAPRPRERSPVPQPTMRWGDAEEQRERSEPERPIPEPRRTPSPAEEIVILGTEVGPPRPTPIRPAARGSSRPRPDPGPRRTRRPPRPARPAPAPEPTRNIASVAGLSGAIPPLIMPDERRPLVAPTSVAEMPPPSGRPAAPTAERIQRTLSSPERIREALVLNAVLGPPVASRGLRRRG
jgi:hypothetical protein